MKLWKISFRYIQKQKLLSTFTVIAVSLSVMILYLFGIVMQGASSLQEVQLEKTLGSYHARFFGINNEQREQLEKDVRILQIGEMEDIGIVESKGEAFVFTGIDENSFVLMGLSLKSGLIPQNEKEIILEQRMLDKLGLSEEIPQKIELTITDFNGEHERIKEYVLSGILHNHISGESVPRGWGYVDKTKLTEHDMLLRFPDSDNIYAMIWEVMNDYKLGKENITYNEGLLSGLSGEGQDNGNLGMFFIVAIVLISSSMLIFSMYGVSLNMRRKQFALLRCAGATSGQIKSIIFGEAFSLSLIGCISGIMLGIFSKDFFINMVGKTISPEAFYMEFSAELIELLKEHTKVSWTILILAIAVGMGITLLSIWMTALNITKTPKAGSLVQKEDESVYIKSRKPRKIGNIINFIAKTNLQRNRFRTFFTVLTMGIALIAFMCIFTYTETIDSSKISMYMMDSDFTLHTDMPYIMPTDLLEYLNEEEIEQIAEMEGVESVKLRYSTVYFSEDES